MRKLNPRGEKHLLLTLSSVLKLQALPGPCSLEPHGCFCSLSSISPTANPAQHPLDRSSAVSHTCHYQSRATTTSLPEAPICSFLSLGAVPFQCFFSSLIHLEDNAHFAYFSPFMFSSLHFTCIFFFPRGILTWNFGPSIRTEMKVSDTAAVGQEHHPE